MQKARICLFVHEKEQVVLHSYFSSTLCLLTYYHTIIGELLQNEVVHLTTVTMVVLMAEQFSTWLITVPE